MGVELLMERYQSQITAVSPATTGSSFKGTLPKWCYAQGMTDYSYERQIRIFAYP